MTETKPAMSILKPFLGFEMAEFKYVKFVKQSTGLTLSPLLCVIVMEAISREFRIALPWELLYADDLVVIAEREDDLIKRLNEWKDNVENRGMRVNMKKTKVMISGERQKQVQKAVRWPCGVYGRGAVMLCTNVVSDCYL